MTKKDYKAIAFVIKCAYTASCDKDAANEVLVHVIHDLAEYMKLDNPRFEYNTFYRACGRTLEEL